MYGLEHSNGGLITFPGGVPLLDAEGAFIGSIGVSEGPNVPSREAAWIGLSVFTQISELFQYSMADIGRQPEPFVNKGSRQKNTGILTPSLNVKKKVWWILRSVKNSSDKLILGKRWKKDGRFYSKNTTIRKEGHCFLWGGTITMNSLLRRNSQGLPHLLTNLNCPKQLNNALNVHLITNARLNGWTRL